MIRVDIDFSILKYYFKNILNWYRMFLNKFFIRLMKNRIGYSNSKELVLKIISNYLNYIYN